MEKNDSRNAKDMRKQNFEAKKVKPSQNAKNRKDKSLPWWVEILFVQIGLPDKFLIKILKGKKYIKELINSKATY